MIDISRWIHGLEPGSRLRLYLVDLPEGMSVQTLAITVVAPEERFDEVIEETAPIIDSIEFHPQSAVTWPRSISARQNCRDALADRPIPPAQTALGSRH